MKSISELQKEAYEQAVKSGWHEEPRSVGDLICLMHSELSEALEEFRNGHKPDEVYSYQASMTTTPGKPEGVPIELADCVIRIMDFCGRHNIDLEKAIVDKMAYNVTRSHRHGGKKL